MELKNLYIQKMKETLYLGLEEGESYARTYWNNSIDSCLYAEIEVEILLVVDTQAEKFTSEEYLLLDNGKTLLLSNEQDVFEYFKNKGII